MGFLERTEKKRKERKEKKRKEKEKEKEKEKKRERENIYVFYDNLVKSVISRAEPVIKT